MLALCRETEPISRHEGGHHLSGSHVALPLFGIDLVVDSRARDYFPDPKASAASSPPRVPPASAPLVHARAAEGLRHQVRAFDAVPAAVMERTPYLQHLREKAEEKAAEADARAADDRVLRDFNAVMGGALMQLGAKGGQIVPEAVAKRAFEHFATTGDTVGAQQLIVDTMRPHHPQIPSPTAAIAAHAANGTALDDIPAPSGLPCDPWSARPKLRMHSADKKRHLESLLRRNGDAGDQHHVQQTAASVTTSQPPLPLTPAADVTKRSKAHGVLQQFEAFHAQRTELAAVRLADRHAQHTANLYRRHSTKITRPVLQRRTISETELCVTD